ncbi:MAG TPA: serine/threonine-protein kinase [Thermoanaerobaculia bacterium]|nr:serine/threonine-protein kinase [Thermoanaerobaculia bacterium]
MSEDADRLPTLFARALELDTVGQQALIAEVAADDAALAGGLERLLARSGETSPLDVSPWSGVAGDSLGETGNDLRLEPALAGQVLGAYTLRAPIGRGGMGSVWLAERNDGRFVGVAAVKLLNAGLLGREGEARFQREGSILARLRHPHIAHLIDAGVSSLGQPYLVLEHVDGERIDEYCDARELPTPARIRLFLDVLAAVSHAHANLVVHRDLKPSNVLVTRDGQVKLLDFGIAKLIEADDGEPAATALTREGAALLTPEYAAPEQLTGGAVTTATDIHALGTLLYVLLVGRHPAAASRAPAVLFQAIVRDEPQRLSAAVADTRTETAETLASNAARRGSTPQRLRRLLKGDLETVVAKALKKRPEERYPSAEALAADLRRYLDHQPVSARPDSLGYRARKFVARNRLPVAAAATAALALLAGTTVAVWEARAAARERDRALEELRRAEITNDFSAFVLSAAAPGGGQPMSRGDLLESGERYIERRYAGDLPLRLHLLMSLAERYYGNGQYEAWKRLAERAHQLSRPLGERRLRARASCLLANVRSEAHDGKAAGALVAEGLADLAADEGAFAEEASCRVSQARAAFERGDVDVAIAAAERALALEQQRRGPPGRELEALNALGNVYPAGGRYLDADRTFARLTRLFVEQGRDRTQSAAICANNWAIAAQSAGQMLHAADLSARAVALARDVDPDKGVQPHVLSTWASALSAVGRFDQAQAVIDEAVERARTAEQDWMLGYALRVATSVALDAGRRELALRRFAEYAEEVGEERSLRFDTTAARVALARGDLPEAVRLARAAVERATKSSEKKEPIEQLLILASALTAHGELAESRALAERSVRAATERLGGYPHSHYLGQAHLELGLAAAGAGDAVAAREALRAAVADLRASDGEAAPDLRRAAEALRRLGG